jgi:hypothetical protein
VGGGGNDSGGSSTTAGKGGRPSGGSSTGGSSAAGTDAGGTGNGGGTTSSDGGSPMTDGGAPSWHFGDPTSCDGTFLFCDDFESVNSEWPPGAQWKRAVITGAPSGTHVMQTGFHDAPLGFRHAEFSLSFWVRFPGTNGNAPDQPFITWPRAQADLTFGVEEGLFRFRTANNGQAASAPEQASDTQNAVIDTWACVKLVGQNHEVRATVTVLGQKPVELPAIGGAADAGVDQKLMQLTPGGALAFDIGDWILGEGGTDIQIDDVRVGAPTSRTICDDYNDNL